MEITLHDTNGNSCSTDYRWNEAWELQSEEIGRDPEFGDAGHTESAEIDGIKISGDLWRFLEGSLGLDAFYEGVQADDVGKRDILERFLEPFANAKDDASALVAWDLLVTERIISSQGIYSGLVTKVDGGVVTQRTNREGVTVQHALDALSVAVAVGDVVEIKYSGGVGVVSGKGVAAEVGR